MVQPTATRVLGPRDGKAGALASIGMRFMIGGTESGGGFSLVEHPMPPRALAAPLHRHSREDEYSFVLEGRVGALLGEEVLYGEPGDLIFKPRGQWHTFWNAGERPARMLELISPAGFERYFEELVDLPTDTGPPTARMSPQSPLATDWSSTSRASPTFSSSTGSNLAPPHRRRSAHDTTREER
jgi:mannose-6-phosphate isomerase-like protein (cupin superfamily)